MKNSRLNCIKYILFFLNLIFTVSGLLVVVAGVIFQGSYRQYLDFLGYNFFSTPIFIIILGCIIFVIAFFGCCGAIKENHCMTLTFACLLGIVFISEIVAGVAAYHLKAQVRALIEENMEAGMKHFNQTGHEVVTDTWAVVQQKLSCCGTQSYHDWVNTTFSAPTSSVPDSCCVYDVVGCGRGILSLDTHQAASRIHMSGCLDSLSIRVKDKVATVGGLAIVIAFIQFVGLVFSFCLANSIRRGYQLV